ncbi:hypothetical protein BH23BAC1_BH23BAC1_25550 [soil metagenome]
MATAKESHLTSLMCITQGRFAKLIKEIEKAGYEVIITSSYRSTEKQLELYNKLKGQKNGRAAKKSKHEHGIAVDINLKKKDKYWRKNTSKQEWEKTGVPKIAKDLGFRWGGDFSNNYDPIHFDLSKDFSTNKLSGELEAITQVPADIAFYCKVKNFYRHYYKDWTE